MNNYPSWWNQNITVYNKYEGANRAVTWYRTVLTGCFWKCENGKVQVGETEIVTNSTLCRVRKNDNFVEKYLWVNLADKSTKFTFGPGDIIVRGSVTDTVDEYTAGSRSSDLINKYKKLQGCMVIEQCSVNTGGGRGNEHYSIRGL